MTSDRREEKNWHNGDEGERSEREEKYDHTFSSLVPAYPFNGDFSLEFRGSRINVAQHLCKQHPSGTRGIVIFIPGVNGGVGPCRQPGDTFDDAALYPTLAQQLVEDHDMDCYRCSWPFMRPHMQYAVHGTCCVVHHALRLVMKGHCGTKRKIQVFLVGHSLGGAVAIESANFISERLKSLEQTSFEVAGVCTLNGALNIRQLEAASEGDELFPGLHKARCLLICGDCDEVVEPEATSRLLEKLPTGTKRQLTIPGATHDLFTAKTQLLNEITCFLTEGSEST